jgi:hypothetical protein
MTYKRKSRWTYVQIEYLKNNCDTMRDEDIAKSLGKTLKAIRRKRQDLGLAKLEGRSLVKLRPDSAPRRGPKLKLPALLLKPKEGETIHFLDIGGYPKPPSL